MKVLKLTVMLADGVPDLDTDYSLPGDLLLEEKVPVQLEFDPRFPPLGWARLEMEGEKVVAHCEFYPEVPALKGLYPCASGQLTARRKTDKGHRVEMRIIQLGLCKSSNRDRRIEAISNEPV